MKLIKKTGIYDLSGKFHKIEKLCDQLWKQQNCFLRFMEKSDFLEKN